MYLEFKYPSVTCNYTQQTLVNVSKYIFSYGVTLDFITIFNTMSNVHKFSTLLLPEILETLFLYTTNLTLRM